MVTKFVVRWVSVLAILAVGLFSGVAFAAPGGAAVSSVCPEITVNSLLGADYSINSPSANLAVQEEAVLSAATGSPVAFASLAFQAATNAAARTIQEQVVLSAATGNSVAFASLASQAATNSAALVGQ